MRDLVGVGPLSQLAAVFAPLLDSGVPVGMDLAKALSMDDRIGGRLLHPGWASVAAAFPKDIRAFVHRAEELGVGKSVALLRQVDAIDRRRREPIVDLVREQAGGTLRGVRVCALGAAFKPNSDDVRDAPTPPSIVDGRHALDPAAWRTAGWTHRALGRAA